MVLIVDEGDAMDRRVMLLLEQRFDRAGPFTAHK